jgi:hypothetical protein
MKSLIGVNLFITPFLMACSVVFYLFAYKFFDVYLLAYLLGGVELSSKVKQANFRLPLEYMALIDEIALKESITKATVITRALDCMQASYDSGNGGMPVKAAEGGSVTTGVPVEEVDALKAQLQQAETRAASAEQQLQQTTARAEALEASSKDTSTRASDAQRLLQEANTRADAAERSLEVLQRSLDTAEARALDAFNQREEAEERGNRC